MVQLLSKMATYLLWFDKGVLALTDSGTIFSDINLSSKLFQTRQSGQKSWIMLTHIKWHTVYLCLLSCTRAVPEVRRQSLKCFKMTLDNNITVHVCTLTCVFHIVDIHKQLNRRLLLKWSHDNATPAYTEHFEIFSHYIDKNCR